MVHCSKSPLVTCGFAGWVAAVTAWDEVEEPRSATSLNWSFSLTAPRFLMWPPRSEVLSLLLSRAFLPEASESTT